MTDRKRKGRRAKSKGFVRANTVVSKLLAKYGINTDTYAIFESIWDKELGKLARRIELVGRQRDTLLVKVDNPAYMQELKLRKKEIIEKINGHFGKAVIDNIKITR